MPRLNIFFDKYYYLTIFIIARNYISRSYKDSYLGIVWILLTPMSQVMIYTLVMPRIMRFPTELYIIYLVSSILLWGFISNCILAGTNALINNADALKRCTVSKTIFPLAELAQHIYKFFVAFIITYGIIGSIYSSLNVTVLLLPLYLIPVCITLGSLMIALSFITPYIKDLREIIVIILNFAFWATPIVYPISIFPIEKQFLFYFNPFYLLIKPLSELVYTGNIPAFMDVFRMICLMIFTVSISYLIYKKFGKKVIYYL